MQVFLAHHIGTRVSLRVYEPAHPPEHTCSGKYGYHSAMEPVKDILHNLNYLKKHHHYRHYGGSVERYPRYLWPDLCDHCGQPFEGEKQVFNQPLYDTPSGLLEPGAMFWSYWPPEDWDWDNQKGPSLHVICPNGVEWNIDGRANNCTMKDDRKHRCWIRTGEPPFITVGKNGFTCNAGAGSIQAGDYHGYLVNGEFRKER
jgi:hypothetical protein